MSNPFENLSPAAQEFLGQLFTSGPIHVSLTNAEAAAEVCQHGLAYRHYGWVLIASVGIDLALSPEAIRAIEHRPAEKGWFRKATAQ